MTEPSTNGGGIRRYRVFSTTPNEAVIASEVGAEESPDGAMCYYSDVERVVAHLTALQGAQEMVCNQRDDLFRELTALREALAAVTRERDEARAKLRDSEKAEGEAIASANMFMDRESDAVTDLRNDRDQARQDLERVKAELAKSEADGLEMAGDYRELSMELDGAVAERDALRGEAEAVKGLLAEALPWLIRLLNQADPDCPICAGQATPKASGHRKSCTVRRIEAAIASPARPGEGGLSANRCAACGWPLKESAADGCVRANCSQRPHPKKMYDPERFDQEQAEAMKPADPPETNTEENQP